MTSRHAGIVALGLTLFASAMDTRPRSSASSLVGTWRLVEFTDTVDGKVVHQFGDKPLGIFIYAPSGRMSIHVLHNPVPQRFDDLNLPGAEQDALEARSYIGYFGAYEVDVRRSMVTHRVEGGTRLSYIGIARDRPFRIDGNRLTIGDDTTWRRVLERIPDRR